MGIVKKIKISKGGAKSKNIYSGEAKFCLVSCPVKESFCHQVLDEINELYAESELARINNEYLKSVELLQEAYYKTLNLSESSCIKCANLFQSNINQTLEIMKDELYEMSHGIFRTKSNNLAYTRLCNWAYK